MKDKAPRPFTYHPPSDPLDIVYSDAHYVIVNKPAGLLSVPGKTAALADCLEARVQAQWPQARIIHRLDMSTSGVMVMALGPEAHRHIGLQFEHRQTRKSYIAHVWGRVQGASGRIDLPLICDWPNRPLQKVDFEVGKAAQTDWEVLTLEEDYTRLRLHPKTGRSHQLRVHMLSLGHPILGDRLYAHERAFGAAGRLLLHAESLGFRHPDGGAHMHYSVPSAF
ncbi:MAG: RNA pseudouridine synthase [Rhodobacteraceae bacterium]|nr:RNA pseudouridine synthase [Paracoccaceae bacterium]